MRTFLIDARFLLRTTTETFWGAPLIVVNGSDNTFSYGFMRDFLRLRNLLHINAGVIALGTDVWSLAAQKNIRTVVEFCREIGVMVIEGAGPLAISAAHADRFTDIVSDDERLLYFCTAKRTIHLARRSGSIEPMTAEEVHHRMGVRPQCIPTYLALTEAGKPRLTTNGGSIRTNE
jgi:hypothetical protein